ncbi:MAG: squalene/phytoene synthase family protein [Paracoccaceae bacterium]
MSVTACAALVERGDPDRFAATMAAPPGARANLWPLYAYNLEIARAPWVTPEPMIAEMRLQFWIDTVEEIGQGKPPRAHEVAAPLAELINRTGIPPRLLIGMAEARYWDIGTEPFADRAAFDAHIDTTAGNLMWAAAHALGAPADAEAAIRDFAWGAGLAAWFRAVPELEARGRIPVIDGRPAALAELAAEGRTRIAAARARRAAIPRSALPALWTGSGAPAILAQVEREPSRVASGTLGQSDFGRRGGLLWRALLGRI